ncbi:MAG: tetratricopeptide repeat protein [Cyanobacteria bacterium]|nr:tetratricopeptide repeat protein [Cyanobacteriota bacterium]
MEKAESLLKKGDAQSAQSIYTEYLKQTPKSSEALLGLARINIRKYNFPEARRQLEKAAILAPGNVEIFAELAHLFHMWSVGIFPTQEDYHPRAEEYFRQAGGIDPSNPLYLAYYGDWQLDQGDWISAEKTFYQALGQSRNYVPAFQGLTRYYMKSKNYKQAKNTCLQAIELEPDNSESYFLMAQLLTLSNHPEESVKYAEKSELTDYGTLPERDMLLAKEYDRLGNAQKALTYFERINGYAPNQAQVVVKIAELSDTLGNQEKSLRFYQKAISLDATLLDTMVEKAQAALRDEKVVNAIQKFRRILSIQPNSEQAIHGLASAHYLNYFYNQVNSTAVIADLERLNNLSSSLQTSPLIQMDRIKMTLALKGSGSSTLTQQLNTLSQSRDDLAAGEALFILGRFKEAQERLDAVDGETGAGYLLVGDRLLLDQELVASAALYQRGYQLEQLPALKQGLARISAKQRLAEQKLKEGNLLFDAKKYAEALPLYIQSARIQREVETPYLRLGDTYEKLHEKEQAAKAYQQAVAINPGLLDSKPFAKKYKSLSKNAQ